MRLARNWQAIRAFRTPLNLLSPTVITTTTNRQLGFDNLSNCTCERTSKHSTYISNNSLNLRTAFRCVQVHRKYFSDIAGIENSTLVQNKKENGTKTWSRTLDQIVFHLQADIRRRRRIHKADINNAIELVEQGKVEDFGVFLLNCCSDMLPDFPPFYRVKMAERIWAVIQKGKEYNLAHFETMLKTLAVNEDKTLDPLAFLEEASSVGVNVSGTMYFFALLVVCQRGDLDTAVKILNAMKENGIPVNEKFFSALMLGNMRAGDYKGATDILDIMNSSHIEPTIHTWFTLLQIHIEMGNVKEVRNTFTEWQFTEDQLYDLLKAAAKQDNREILELVIERVVESEKMHAPSIMNLALHLMQSERLENALRMIIKFENVLRTRKEPLGAFFIKELFSTNNIDNISDPGIYLNIVTALQKHNRNPYALNLAAESCLKQKRFEMANKLFEGMLSMGVPVRPHYFLPEFVTEMQSTGIAGGVQVLRKMRELDIQPDWEMLVNWFIPLMYNEQQDMVETVRIVKEACGLSYSSGGLFSAGLIVALQAGRIQQSVALVEKCKGKISSPEAILEALLGYICNADGNKDLNSVAKLLKCVSENKPSHDIHDCVGVFILKLLEVDRSEEAEILSNHIVEFRIPVSQAAAQLITDRVQFTGHLEIDSALSFTPYSNGEGRCMTHVSEMNDTELECHKQELESKGMNTRGTIRKLFLKYCSAGKLDKVLECKSSFEKEHGPISRGMKAALMGVYIKSGLLEPALELYHELSGANDGLSDVVIDVYKIIDLATLMVEKGLIEEGLELVKDKCPTRKIQRPEIISRNIVRLLESVSQADSQNGHVLDLTQLFLRLRFMKPSNPTLAPSIKNYIRRHNLEAAVTLLEEYAKNYSLTPCLQELTYGVLERPELFERVIKCSISTKGEREAKRLLALAKADMGDIDGAAKNLMELGSDLSFTSLIKQCEYLGLKQEIQKILNLICAIEKTGQNYDCKRLYNIAIQSCERAGNKEGLKQVLSHMEEQDMFIAAKLKEYSSPK